MNRIIDAHCHIYPDAIARKAAENTGKFYDGLPATCDGTISQLLELGGKAGITHFVVQSVATKPEQVKSINEFIAMEVASHEGILTGLGTLHPDSEDIEGDIAHLLDLGLKGVKLHSDIQKFKFDDFRCLKIFDLCEGRLPILAHAGDNRFDYSNPNRIIPILKIYQNLTIIGAHFGGYSIWEEAAEQMHGIPNLYVDCSSSMFAMSDERVMSLIRTYGVGRVLFGTDYPMWSPVEEMERFMQLPLTGREREQILYQNAKKVFAIED